MALIMTKEQLEQFSLPVIRVCESKELRGGPRPE